MNDTLVQPRPSLYSTPATQPGAAAPTVSPYGVGFFLFIVLNFVLFVRPSELFTPLLGLELYLVTILLCLAVSFPAVLEQLHPRELQRNPLTVCVIGFTLAVFLSHLSALRLDLAGEWGFDSFKKLLYYLLFIGLVRD